MEQDTVNTKLLSFKIITIVISIFISLLFIEIVLHSYYVISKPLANYYPFLPAKSGASIKIDQYEYKIDYRYNSLGFRDNEIDPFIKASEKRILFLGDSTTEGFGSQVNQRYSTLLLEKLGKKYKEVNVAQLATNPDTYFDNLVTFGIGLKPDLVIMGISLSNDFMGGRAYPVSKKYQVVKDISIKLNKNSSILNEIISLKYIRSLVQQTLNKTQILQKRNIAGNYWDLYFNEIISKKFYLNSLNIEESTFDTITAKFNQNIVDKYLTGKIIPTLLLEGVKNHLPNTGQEEYFYNNSDYENTLWFIKESNKVLKELRIPLVVLIIPDVNQVKYKEFQRVLKEDFNMSTPPARLKQLEEIRVRLDQDLIKEGLIFVDITDKLKSNTENTFYIYDQHLAPKGHKIAAEELFFLLKYNQLIKQ